MDDCTQYLELLSARLDGELSPEEETRLQAHLDRCPACRALLADLTTIQLETSRPGDVPEGFSHRVMERVQADVMVSSARKSLRRRQRMTAGIAAALAVVLWAVSPVGPAQLLPSSGNDAAALSLESNQTNGALEDSSSLPQSDGDEPQLARSEESYSGVPFDRFDAEGSVDPYTALPSFDTGAQPAESPMPNQAEAGSFSGDAPLLLTGELPALLADYPAYPQADGSCRISVPAEDFSALADDLYALGMTGTVDARALETVWICIVPAP